MRGVIVKCNMERARPATDQEWLGAELIRVLSADAKASLERKGQRGYVDATNEPGPEDVPGRSSEPPGTEDSTENRNHNSGDVPMHKFLRIGSRIRCQQNDHLIEQNRWHVTLGVLPSHRLHPHRHLLHRRLHPKDRHRPLTLIRRDQSWTGVLPPLGH